ncbi:unnamed protein product, partial [Cuscuta epithymum]
MVRTRAKMEQRMETLEIGKLATDEALIRMEDRLENLMVAMNRQFETMNERMTDMQNQNRDGRRSRSPHRHRSRTSNSPNTSRGNSTHSHTNNHRRREENPRFPIQPGRKIDLPLFNGVGAYNWVIRMERYFRLNNIDEEEMVEASMVAMEDKALNWFHVWESQTEVTDWETLKKSVIRRFQPELIQNPYDPMLSLKQIGSVQEYREEFEMVISHQKNMDRELLRGIFIKGLKKEIKAELKLYVSKSLSEIMEKATLIE